MTNGGIKRGRDRRDNMGIAQAWNWKESAQGVIQDGMHRTGNSVNHMDKPPKETTPVTWIKSHQGRCKCSTREEWTAVGGGLGGHGVEDGVGSVVRRRVEHPDDVVERWIRCKGRVEYLCLDAAGIHAAAVDHISKAPLEFVTKHHQSQFGIRIVA